MNLILSGPQGCGKGTQAELIVKKYGLYHFSMGEHLRNEIKTGTEKGNQIAEIINNGKYMPDDFINKMFFEFIDSSKAKNGLVLDGYPRSKVQAEFVLKYLKIDAVIDFELSEEETIVRLSSRRICSKCGSNYNLITLKPTKEGICDKCGGKLIHRDDDTPEKIKSRLKEHEEKTGPSIEIYKKAGILHIIDGNQSINKVWANVNAILENLN